MSTIRQVILNARDRGEKAMGLFITSGFPNPNDTLPILEAVDQAGADFIELGMPFSDPLAEGLPVQRSSERALRQGSTLKKTLEIARQFRARSNSPLLLMGYINPIFHFGVSNFCEAARSSGVDGLILPDLPPEESALLEDDARKVGLDLVYLIAPNTSNERIRQIDEKASGFVYAVSITGLTGTGIGKMQSVETYLERARQCVVHNPLLVGFGIKSHEEALRLCRHTDGFLVGSALIDFIEKLWDDDTYSMENRLEEVRTFVHKLKYGESTASAGAAGVSLHSKR